MLGMMNCPTDSPVEFYATPQSQHLKNLVMNIDVHEFVEAKPRHSVTYTEDGRKLLDGRQATPSEDPMKLWKRLLLSIVAARAASA